MEIFHKNDFFFCGGGGGSRVTYLCDSGPISNTKSFFESLLFSSRLKASVKTN